MIMIIIGDAAAKAAIEAAPRVCLFRHNAYMILGISVYIYIYIYIHTYIHIYIYI